MPQINLKELNALEGTILGFKNNLSQISEERWRATLSKDRNATVRARIKASEKTLENCTAVAKYVEHFSPPLANELRSREKYARNLLQEIKSQSDPDELHTWIKTQLIPSAKMSERLAHIVASTTKKFAGENIEFHRWTRHT